MRYTLLLWPHANARYQAEAQKLALNELHLMLDRLCPEASAEAETDGLLPGLSIEAPEPLSAEALSALRTHSLLYGLFERRADGSLMPLAGRARALLGDDLPAILKYKGKTNEMFLYLLINIALWSGDFWRCPDPLTFLDPMCGRATAPFLALNRGWNAVGADIDKNDLKEAEKFYRRYLEYHRYKYILSRESRTVHGAAPVPVARFEAAPAKGERPVALSLACADAARLSGAYGRDRFHLIACDLPYGVQHDARVGGARGGLEALLAEALPGWRRLLKPGGAMAVAFNAQTLRRDRVRGLMADAGLEVCEGGVYDAFDHWVEQAITRDVAVAHKK